MRYFLLLTLGLFLMFTAGSSALTSPPDGPNPKKWKQIDALLKKDQTASAGKLVEEIYQQARRQQDTPEYLRALLYKLRILEEKEENDDEKAIALVEKDLQTAKFPARPILHSLLAQLYARYYQQHRYQLYNRTPGGAQPSDSLATWDAARLGNAIITHYRASLEDEPQRQQQLQLSKLGYAVRGGDAEGRALRPTLYDLLAHRAVDGLGNDEFYVTRPTEQFELKNPALLGSAQDFARLPLQAPTADSLNGQFHALRVWQQITQFRLTDTKNLAALADVDLQRLRFVWQHATFADKDSLYRAALVRGAETYRALPSSTEFLVAAAATLEETQPAQALKLAQEAEKQFPKSRGGQLARVLRQRIEQVTVGFTTEDVVLPNQPWLLKLDVRNTQRLYATAYRVSSAYNLRLTEPDTSNEPFNFQKTFARALAGKPAATWTLDLPTPADYRAHTVQHAGPALPLGYYIILLSTAPENPARKRPGVVTARSFLSVSELSQVHRNTASGMELLVLHRQSGEALPGVRVLPLFQYYSQKEEAYQQRRGTPSLTSAEGTAQILMGMKTGDNNRLQSIFLTRGTDSLLVENLNGYYFPRRSQTPEAEKPQRRTFLYTDRAIYRPGQTLYFKGILTESRAGKNQLLTGQSVAVRLRDVNGQTVQTLNFTTSDFGSFHGSIVLPTGLLNGEMALETDNGSVGFAVEDYKRPTFQVTFAPVQGTPVLGQQIAMRGTATAYAGQAIDGATVQYRVVRRTVWPLFGRSYGRPIYPGGGADVEISNGTAQTDSAGGFVVTFTAKGEAPDGNRRGPWQPGYVFSVTADVTDAAGETRTGEQTVSLGTNALTLRLEVPELLNREDLPALQILSTNATGEAVPARGTLRLYRLVPPARTLRPRAWERPEREALPRKEFKQKFPLDAYAQEDNDSTWARTLVATQEFTTAQSPALPALAAELARQQPGRYLLQVTATPTTDTKATEATTEQFFTLFSTQSAALPVPTPDWFVPLQDSVAPGQPARFLVGSSEAGARILLEAEAKGETLRHEWLTLSAGEQRVVEIPTTAALEGTQLYLHLTQVCDNRLYQHNITVQVVTPPAPLRISLATFRDKLQPGQKETWRVTIHSADGKPAKAELLASLYDKSLDVFRPHSFMELDFPKPYYQAMLAWNGRFGTTNGGELFEDREQVSDAPTLFYPHLTWWGYSLGDEESANDYLLAPRNGKVKFTPPVVKRDEEVLRIASGAQMMSLGVARGTATDSFTPPPPPPPNASPAPGETDDLPDMDRLQLAPDLSTVSTRTDFRETAFWLPDLRTNDKGETVLEFQMPEAVTRWQLLTLAHDQQLHTGTLARTLVTQKQLQVTTNAPRFFRQGDQLTLSAKISNLTVQAASGHAQLFLLDARTQQPLKELIVSPAQQPFSLNGNASTALSWNITIPETAEGQVPLEAITYRVVAQGQLSVVSEQLSGKQKRKQRRQNNLTTNNQQLTTIEDGEENMLPVLPNRLLITESLPLPIVGAGTKTFDLQKLTSTTSPTRRNYSLTLEMTQKPAWYAVQALPYLMEYPYECSEQVFSRLYANLLAASILKQNPRIKPVLAEWQRAAQSGDKQALTSKLEQNQELKALLLQETPWVRDAQTDTERMRRLAELFDEPRLQAETTKALAKLAQMQLPDGAFPWFEKMPADRYITQLIVAGFGKLRKLNAFDATQNPQAQQVLTRALAYLDGQLQKDYADLRKQKNVNLEENHLSPTQVQALYARSFWPKPAVANAAQPAAAYYQQQLATYWPQQNRYLQGLAALTLHRASNPKTAQQIMMALTENALHSPELGMYWKDVRAGYYWQEAPTETQAALIEAYDEVANNQQAVDEMKLWLLKQKQTRNWESTRATADACYALLLRGSDWLTPTQPIQVTVGGEPVTPNKLEAGTGYFKNTWLGAEVKPAQGRVTVTKPDAGVAWGALYWQYFEQIDKITPATTGLQLTRQLFREQRTAGGPVLEPLTPSAPLRVGDVLVVRLVLRADRDLEYVHLKDQRAAGLELINQLSGYQYQSGLGYYESPRDAATNFFISYFPKGTHTFEYRLRAAQAGNFSGGLSQLQCLYAPEFSAHSAGQRVQIAL
ncbi:hypothetical protein H8B15_06500 [Hymenobacter sp. BT507]|uniref:Alpha-2-macroglobulin domain-containing protein n=1 Tax=Hymenobacter citatus TaxID=2763506 RepID=A0ABR7MHL0_9BACT|nr:alpha-2-macroglobulin family protein [Hymenobacter citatus]MBC6610564.1 hypothetical protein [Hymenobacter citatus]